MEVGFAESVQVGAAGGGGDVTVMVVEQVSPNHAMDSSTIRASNWYVPGVVGAVNMPVNVANEPSSFTMVVPP